MSCPHCGRPVDPGAAQCPHCGQPLVRAGAPDPSTPVLAPADVPAPAGSTEMGTAAPQESASPAVGEATPVSPPGYAPSPAWGAPPVPPAPKPRRSRVWLFVGTVVALAVVLASAGIGALYLHGGGLTFPWAVSTPTPQEVVLLRDPLTSNAHGWPVQFGACEFANGGYQISNDFICFAPGPDYPNVDVIVQVRQIGGLQTVPYGIVFRAGTHGNHYEFDVDGGGEWSYWKDVDGQFAPIVYWTYTRAFKWVNSGDTGATNTLEVRAKGNQFQFFINGVNVGHASDGTFSGGRVGMWCGQGGQVVYNNLVISAIP